MSRCGCSSSGASGAAIANSSCITAAGAGTPASPFILSPVIDPDVRNLLACGPAGLLAPDPDNPGAWTQYTPYWTSTGAFPTIGNGILSGLYRKRGHSLELLIALIFGTTTGSGSGAYQWGYPAGLVVGFTSPLPFFSYDALAGAFEVGNALAQPGSIGPAYAGNDLGPGGGGTAIGGGGQGAGSAYYLGGTVYVTT